MRVGSWIESEARPLSFIAPGVACGDRERGCERPRRRWIGAVPGRLGDVPIFDFGADASGESVAIDRVSRTSAVAFFQTDQTVVTIPTHGV